MLLPWTLIALLVFGTLRLSSTQGFFNSGTNFTAPKTYQRFCNSSHTTSLTNMSLSYEGWYTAKVEQVGNRTMIVPYAHITWNFTNPQNVPLDGFGITFKDSYSAHTPPSLYPVDYCEPGRNHFWVQTANQSVCETSNTTCDNYTSGDRCLCKVDCPLFRFENDKLCKHIGNFFMPTMGYFTVPPTVNNLTFKVDWEKNYAGHIMPYYRQWFQIGLNNQLNMNKAVSGCPELLISSGVYNHLEATQICCDHGKSHTTIRNVTVGEMVPDFDRDVANLTITWLPPVDHTENTEFFIFIFAGPHLAKVYDQRWVPYDGPASRLASCDNVTRKYQIKVFDVPRNSKEDHLRLSVHTIYQDEVFRSLCDRQTCEFTTYLTMQALNPCDSRYGACDVNANCTADDATGSTTLNVTCSCSTGYEGNGINGSQRALGTGCKDIHICKSLLSPCVDHGGLCMDNPPPSMSANCSCRPGYSGDGYKSGRGCRNDIEFNLAIAIPMIALFLVIVIAIAWKWRVSRLHETELKWSQFIANSALQYTLPPMNGEAGDCLPTFGDRWEVERERLRLGDVLGRGNYGVVYKGWLGDAFMDKDQCRVVESTAETPVAVKLLKEGQNEEACLSDFLAEIGFMLNVGSHRNVLGVIGCCTTAKPVLLITEFLKYGDLLHFLWDAREPNKCNEDALYHLTEKSLYEMAQQVAQGMSYLTKARIIHGDLAARNILVGENRVCKISDFGLANDVYRYGVIKGQSERCVPFKWISPERMMSGKVPITSKSDVWSFGNLMYEMVTLGCMPHIGISSDELLQNLRSGYRMKKPSTCSDLMYSIMCKCWEWRSSSRPSFSELDRMLGNAQGKGEDADYVNMAFALELLDREKYASEIKQQPESQEESDFSVIISNGPSHEYSIQ